jgi:hypothetical protein
MSTKHSEDQLVMPVIMTETHEPLPHEEHSTITSQVNFHLREERESNRRAGEASFTDFHGKLTSDPDLTLGWRLRQLHFPTRLPNGRFLPRHVYFPIGFEGPETPAEIEQEFGTPPHVPVDSHKNRTPS